MIPSGLRTAARLLTVVPVPFKPGDDAVAPARALVWFPVVGLAIGAAVFAVMLTPLPALPRAALALAVWIGVTGALHEDGFLDCADAALAPVGRERRLEILKDPRAGAHAVTVGGLLLLLRFALLTAIAPHAVLTAPTLGRWFMAVTLAKVPAAATTGLGARFAQGASAVPATAVMLVLLAPLALLTDPATTAAAAVGAFVLGAATARFLSRRFGGLTGDGHGAAGLMAEVGALIASLPFPLEGA